MAHKVINDLDALGTSPAVGDLLAVYDIDESGLLKTKKITIAELSQSVIAYIVANGITGNVTITGDVDVDGNLAASGTLTANDSTI